MAARARGLTTCQPEAGLLGWAVGLATLCSQAISTEGAGVKATSLSLYRRGVFGAFVQSGYDSLTASMQLDTSQGATEVALGPRNTPWTLGRT